MSLKNIIIVAHPDDEILFAYSILRQKECHVICLTGNNRQTRFEFFDVMDKVGASWTIFENDDSWNGSFDETIIQQIKPILNLGFEKIITHNQNGEYGHTQHKSLSDMVFKITDRDLWFFGEELKPLPFSVLKEKMDLLSIYETHGKLGVWDWYDEGDPTNNMMKYVTSEGFRKVK